MATKTPNLTERYVASMVLSGVGDAMGFKNGGWEFKFDGRAIHEECEQLGGVKNLKIRLPGFRVSDDTVMHLATAAALVNKSGAANDKEALYQEIASKYKSCMKDMALRSAGETNTVILNFRQANPYEKPVPFNKRGGGCGAAMRAMCIGLRWPRPEEVDELIAVSVESGRMTHHHPTGYLGALAGALFVSYALQGKPVREWGAALMKTLPRALEYVKAQGRYVEKNVAAWSYFTDKWQAYLKERGVTDGESEPKFPERYGVEERDAAYKAWSFSGWGGSSGHDAPMIAYDALLGAGDDWIELCHRAMLHSGDNDSTGVIAGACFGAMYGFSGVPNPNFVSVEYRGRLVNNAVSLLRLSHPEETVDEQFTSDRASASTIVEEESQTVDSSENEAQETLDSSEEKTA